MYYQCKNRNGVILNAGVSRCHCITLYLLSPVILLTDQGALSGELLIEPVREKTNNLGFRTGPTQTGLYSHRRWLEA